MRGTTRLTLAGAVATVLAAAGLLPLLAEAGWIVPAAIAVLLVAGLGAGLRALGVPAFAVVVSQVLGVLLWLGNLVASDVARLGWLPSRTWGQRLVDTLGQGVDTVRTFTAPVPLDDGTLLIAVGGIALIAVAVDVLAVAARRVPLAGVPLAIMYAVTVTTSPSGPSVWAFVATASGYLLLLAVDGSERARRWGRPLGTTQTGSAVSRTMATSLPLVTLPLAAGALAVAVVGSAVLPQGGLALFGGGQGSGDGGGQTIRTENPIVDLKRDLVRPDNVEVIRYTTSTSSPDYLRLLTLDVYDGTVWRTSDRPVPEDNRVSAGLPPPPGLSPDIATTETEYQVDITDSLESQWLPLPYPAADVRPDAGDWRYHADTLDVVSTDRTTQGLRYDVTALQVEPSPDQLAGLPPIPGRYGDQLALPDDLPDEVRDLAREVTADSADSYEQAVTLQDYFRSDGGFVYDLAFDPGNGSDDLLRFLDERRGYCEQFAATMAIMARVLGIPARVAVGYLRGEQEQPGYWVVRAQDAHAWPELLFEGVGWVRFEPTPGGRTGSPPAYTSPDTAPTDIPESLGNPVDPAESFRDAARNDPGSESVDAGAAAAEPSRLPLLLVLVVLALVALVPLLAGWVVRRRRWMIAGTDPARRAEAAWADIEDAALELGLAPVAHETIRMRAESLRSAAALPVDTSRRLTDVALATEQARYAPSVPAATGLQDDAAAVRDALMSTATRRTRWQAIIWPAPVRRLLRRR